MRFQMKYIYLKMSYFGSDVACHLQKQLNKNNVLDWTFSSTSKFTVQS